MAAADITAAKKEGRKSSSKDEEVNFRRAQHFHPGDRSPDVELLVLSRYV